MIEFGLWQDLDRIVTATDLRMERILRRAAWPLERRASHAPSATLAPWPAI